MTLVTAMLGSSTSYRWTKATAFPVVPTPVDSLPRGGGSLLQGIVICNKTWAHHYTPKVYRQLWCGEGKGILHLSRPKFGSASKVSWPFYRISEVFLDINLQYERRSINSSHYCEPTIIANWQKIWDFPIREVISLHDCARPHSTLQTH